MCGAVCDGSHGNSPPGSQKPADGFQHDTPDRRASWARWLIRGYQDYISALKMGPTCRFDPTCSNYALTAFGRHGTIKGLILTLGRLARCGPWHPGGWDPVPPRRRSSRR